MERHELQELHYITPICNVSSMMQNGILSHVRSKRVPHKSVAMREVQDRRACVRVPGARRLHEYVNLYVCARNPMLYKRLDQREQICVLSVSSDVLDLNGVIITDQNAGGNYVQFRPAPVGLGIVNRELTFAESWVSPDKIDFWRRKAAKCAEVLVPDCVEPRLIRGAYVCSDRAKDQLEAQNTDLAGTIDRHLFFL